MSQTIEGKYQLRYHLATVIQEGLTKPVEVNLELAKLSVQKNFPYDRSNISPEFMTAISDFVTTNAYLHCLFVLTTRLIPLLHPTQRTIKVLDIDEDIPLPIADAGIIQFTVAGDLDFANDAKAKARRTLLKTLSPEGGPELRMYSLNEAQSYVKKGSWITVPDPTLILRSRIPNLELLLNYPNNRDNPTGQLRANPFFDL